MRCALIRMPFVKCWGSSSTNYKPILLHCVNNLRLITLNAYLHILKQQTMYFPTKTTEGKTDIFGFYAVTCFSYIT